MYQVNKLQSFFLPTLESGIDVGQGINVGPGKFVKKVNVGHAQKVQSYVKKDPNNLKISVFCLVIVSMIFL